LPAAINSDELQDVTYNSGSILVPLLPSAINVSCASRFIWRERKRQARRFSQLEHLASSQPDPALRHHLH